MAPDVGRAGRRARRHVRRPRRAAGPRRACRSVFPRSASCSSPSPSVSPSRRRVPWRRSRPTSPAGRSAGDSRSASCRSSPCCAGRSLHCVTLTDGSWFAPRTTMMTLLAPRVAADDFGDFRVLYIGDPRVLPAAPHDLGDGIAYALTGAGVPHIADRWTAPGTRRRRRVAPGARRRLQWGDAARRTAARALRDPLHRRATHRRWAVDGERSDRASRSG